ncbi:MAG: accessory factor UbiK family protein [Pseudohongiellaceae bacterium]
MLNSKFINDLVNRLAEVLPDPGPINAEIRSKMEQVISKGIDELDLLTRDEFQATAERLQRAEQRIAELERTLAALADEAEPPATGAQSDDA